MGRTGRWRVTSRRALVAGAVLAAGLVAGFAIGGQGIGETETLTVAADPATVTTERLETRTATVTQRRTVTETETQVVTEPPTGPGVFVDYAQYEGRVRLHGLQRYLRDYGLGQEIVGQLEFLGGDCDIASYVEVSGTFFDSTGRILETAFTNKGEVARGSRVPFDIGFDTTERTGRVELVVTGLNC